MGNPENSPLPFGMDRLSLRLDKQDPYLSLHFVMVFVRDQERSLRFYLDQLGFRLIVDQRVGGFRWVEVAPPDGSANLALVQAQPDSVAELVGRDTRIYFITEDIQTKYEEWSSRGVRFESPPCKPQWGGIFTRFEDPDGNSFGLAGFDELTHGAEMRRRAITQKLEAERQAERELEIARQVQMRLFPQRMPEARTLDYAGACLQARHVGGDYYDFLDLGQRRLALVIGDIAGKGIAAALLMANLQANLRSQCATAADQPGKFLQSVNQLFCANTAGRRLRNLFLFRIRRRVAPSALRQLRTCLTPGVRSTPRVPKNASPIAHSDHPFVFRTSSRPPAAFHKEPLAALLNA
jgi:catechol 2,3-dioxygenase-like lactoylglutathione lyase family enzyme